MRTLYAGRLFAMQGYASTENDFSSKVEEWMDTVAAELKQAVTYVDRVIVPEVRRESGSAMRMLAAHLERWADQIDPAGKREQ